MINAKSQRRFEIVPLTSDWSPLDQSFRHRFNQQKINGPLRLVITSESHLDFQRHSPQVQDVYVTASRATVRIAPHAEIEAMLELDWIIPMNHASEVLLSARTKARKILIAEIDGLVVGYLALHDRAFFGQDFVELLIVNPGNRRQGVGQELLEHAVAHSSTSRIFTSTNASNTLMLSLLQKNNWELSGRLDGIDANDPEVVFFTGANPVHRE